MTPKQLDITRKAFAKGTLRGVISTYVFKQGVNLVHLKVLIRADSTTSEIASVQIPGRLSRLDEGKNYGYLIDFDDTFTPWAKGRSDKREALYKEQGWERITREELLDDLRAESHEQSDDAVGEPAAEA
jgi:superfamily II DNA or RNA helicase